MQGECKTDSGIKFWLLVIFPLLLLIVLGGEPFQSSLVAGRQVRRQIGQATNEPERRDKSNGQQTTTEEPKRLTIEVAVFIDQTLSNKFTSLAELNRLVLTIMNQVRLLFSYRSLKQQVNIKLVLIEHLRDSERKDGIESPNPERGDIDLYLSNFCRWQNSRLSREEKVWWDHAILLSGLVPVSIYIYISFETS